jgi:hypothetical protein
MRGADDTIMVTVPIPREALVVTAPPPVLLSQRNVEQVVGVPPESYLKMLRAPDFSPTIIVDGKLRMVRREDFVAWLEKHRAAPMRVRTTQKKGAADDDVAAIAAELGLTPGRGRR